MSGNNEEIDINDLLKKVGNEWQYGEGFKQYLVGKSCNYTGVKDMAMDLGLTEYLVKKIIKDNDLKLDFKILTNNTNFKAIYHDYNWCYEKYMIEGLNHHEMAVESNASERVIKKWCCEKHRLTQKYRQSSKQLSEIQYDLIIGSLIGDGHIDKRETQPLFIVSHAENQKDYLYWKYNLLKDFCNSPPSKVKGGIRFFGEKEYQVQDAYRISTRIQDCFLKLREKSIYDVVSKLNEFSLSIFSLDDGYRGDSQWGLCVAKFNQKDKDYFMNVLKNRFDINSYICNYDDRYIYLYAEDSRKLDDIILKNIPNELDVIKYKITENDDICKPSNYRMIQFKGGEIGSNSFSIQNNVSYNQVVKLYNKGINCGQTILDILREGDIIE